MTEPRAGDTQPMTFVLQRGRPPRPNNVWLEKRERRSQQQFEDALRREIEQEEHWQRHKAHRKEQVGRCVYCVDCHERLYQGTL